MYGMTSLEHQLLRPVTEVERRIEQQPFPLIQRADQYIGYELALSIGGSYESQNVGIV